VSGKQNHNHLIVLLFPQKKNPKGSAQSEICQGDKPRLVVGTVAVGTAKKDGNGNTLLERIITSAYDLCRTHPQNGLIPEFPDFGPLLAEMEATNKGIESQGDAGYQVTVLHPDGALIIKEPFFEQFGMGDNEIPEFHEIVKAHDATYNQNGVRLAPEAGQTQPQEMNPESVAPIKSDVTAETLANIEVSKPQLNMKLESQFEISTTFRCLS